jgi:hypothetical protein
MFCHEGPWHKLDRIWTIRADGSQLRKIHTRTMAMEIFGHEFWSADGKISAFRQRYVGEIVATIKANAREEFELMWREHQEHQLPLTTLSNRISERINATADAVAASELACAAGRSCRVPTGKSRSSDSSIPRPNTTCSAPAGASHGSQKEYEP